MSETAGSGTSWLPARVQRSIAAEEARERREERDAQRKRDERREQAHDRALGAYRAAAEDRGEVVSAMAIARGEVTGRDINDILGDARAAADREDIRQASRDRREDVHWIDQEPTIHGASRSAWPESEWELDRLIRRAQQDHSWFVAYRARLASREGRYEEHAAAVRDERA